MLGKIRRYLSDERGTTALEFTIVMMGMFGLTMGIYDFGRATWAYNAAQKATQVGSQMLAVRDPLHLPIKYHFNCNPPTDTSIVGNLCNPGDDSMEPNCFFATVTCQTDSCDFGGDYDEATEEKVWKELVAKMQDAYEYLREEDIRVVYKATNLGFIGKPNGPVVEVTTRIVGDSFNFVGLAPFGLGSMSMPTFETTITSEDLSDNSELEQGIVRPQGNEDDPVCE